MNNPMTDTKHTEARTDALSIAGDALQKALLLQKEEFREDLRWIYNYAAAQGWSQNQLARELDVSSAVVSQIWAGKYRDARNGVVLPPPAKMLARIRRMRADEKDKAATLNAGRVETPTVRQIWTVCDKAWSQRKIALIFGEPQIGKSEALKWYRDEHNHGNTVYVDLSGVSGVQDIYREFAKALRLGYTSPARLKYRVYDAIDARMLIIVDEFHQITHAYRRSSSVAMIEAIRSIFVRCGCGMVICSTDIGRREIESGHDAGTCRQLSLRGSIRLQLPPQLTVGDVAAMVRAYGLAWPDTRTGATWKQFKPEHVGQDYCCDIAHTLGMNYLVICLQDASIIASKAKRKMTWDDFCRAHEIYDALKQPKHA